MNINEEKYEKEFVKEYVKENEISYRIVTGIMRPIAWLVYRPISFGVENIPKDVPVIIACNHRGVPDPAFTIYAYRKRAIRFLAKKSLHDSVFGFIFRMALTIPVDRSRKNPESMLAAETALKHNKVIGIYPEGTRNKSDDILLPFKYGAVALAQKCGAYLVPSVNIGSYKPFVSQVRTYFGEAYKIDPDADLNVENAKLRQKMYDLYFENGTDDPKVQRIKAERKER